jgi:ribosomal protein L37AE/L43A
VRCESRLLDPADDEHVSLELHLQCVRLKDNGFSWVVSLDTARRLRDQLTEHLDAAQATEADTCPGCGTIHGVQRITGTSPTVQAGMCAACGLHWATTVANPALSIISLLPTPQRRTAALLAVLHTEVTRRSRKGPSTMTVTLCLPATEVISIDAMASVDTAIWRCRLCDHHGTATTRPTAHSEGIEHLTAQHHATIGTAP